MALKLAEPPENVDRTLWLYELCRFLIQKVNSIIVGLFSDSPACSSITCPEMRASEWQYLCAVHDPPKSCCAIDYCCHTLDWAANTLTSPKHFPSRLALGTDQSTQHSQARQLTNIFRRVYRIFAHAWFQHREMFWSVEARSGLYMFFKTVCDHYGLIPADNYTIPSEAEGLEPDTETRSSIPPLILKREPPGPGLEDSDNISIIDGLTDHNLSTAGTTKRHRHSPSVGATAVSTVVEESEEEEDQPKELLRPVTQLFELTPKEETAADSEEDEEEEEEEEEEEDSDEAEANGAEEPTSALLSVPDDETQKQSASEDAKADPTPEIEEKGKEKENEEAGNTPSDADEANAAEVDTVDTTSADAKEAADVSTESEDVPKAAESATTATEPETKKTDAKPATIPDDPPADDAK
jgi:hypothetical protein